MTNEEMRTILDYQAALIVATSTSFTSAMLDMAFVTGIDANRLTEMLHQCDSEDFEGRVQQFAGLVASTRADCEPVGIISDG